MSCMADDFKMSRRPPDTYACPKCSRKLSRCGEIESKSTCFSVFRCIECLMTVDLQGEPAELPFTFAVDETGRAIRP